MQKRHIHQQENIPEDIHEKIIIHYHYQILAILAPDG